MALNYRRPWQAIASLTINGSSSWRRRPDILRKGLWLNRYVVQRVPRSRRPDTGHAESESAKPREFQQDERLKPAEMLGRSSEWRVTASP